LPQGELTAGFGEMGYSLVIDREGRRILFPPRLASRRSSIAALLGPSGWSVDPGLLESSAGRFSYSEEGTTRVGSFLSLDDPPWTVVSSESLDEFAAPFARTGSFNLLVVLVVTAVISVAFIVVARRATDSLKRLTVAADEMAAGNLDPTLPPGGKDEVGKLSGAFSVMVERVRDMIRRVEESRHMSAIGEFAAQLSHEIRNPLTSIKLNLQRLDRGVRDQRIPAEYEKAVRISLREAKRLDGTVRGVLSISRTRAPQRNPESLHHVLRSAMEALAPQSEEEEVTVEAELFARNDTVLGDRELLKGAFLNLFLNSLEVMDSGGVLRITTENVSAGGRSSLDAATTPAGGILVRISDDGPGVPDDVRDRIFDPFFTTKEDGSGFGLPLAVRVMEEHGGTLALAQPEYSREGATFLVVLPLAAAEKDDLAFAEDAGEPERDATASGDDLVVSGEDVASPGEDSA
jgi:signal transduction histidine kinase